MKIVQNALSRSCAARFGYYSYSNLVLRMMKNVCTVDKMTPSITHLLNALSPELL